MNIYAECVELGIPTNSHYSDLYIPANQQTAALLKKHNITTAKIFTNQVEGGLWYDIPFAYSPWWEKRRGAAV
jgi:hypothetical protein